MDAFVPLVKSGFMVSVPLTLASFVFGMMIATAVALVRVMPRGGWLHRMVLAILKVYISIIRGTPMVVQLAIVFYGLPAMNVFIDPIPAAIIGFSLGDRSRGDFVRAQRAMGSGFFHRHDLYADLPPHHRAASLARCRATVEQLVYRLV